MINEITSQIFNLVSPLITGCLITMLVVGAIAILISAISKKRKK